MNQFLEEAAKLLAQALDGVLSEQEILETFEIPKEADKGDFSFPVFRLAKALRKAPPLIAKELSEKIHSETFRVEAVAAYLNFFIERTALASKILSTVLENKDTYGSSTEGNGKTHIIEYNSANISKHMQVGYIRGLMIGSSLLRIADFLGYKTVAINHLGDYGINFGMIISAFKRWGSDEALEQKGVAELQALYTRFRKEEANDPSLMEEARYWFKKLEEEKDPEAVSLWERFKEISLRDYAKVYEKLESRFDSFNGEAFYSDRMPAVRQELLDKGLITLDQGAEIVDLSDENLPNIVVTTSAGTSLYITRDIAAALYRKQTYNFDKVMYVVGSEQRLHFQQLKAVLKKMGYEFYRDLIHVDHGLIMMEGGGKMSSRSGDIVLLNDVLDEAQRRMLEIIEAKNPELEKKDSVAKMTGYGAIAYKELSNSRVKDYVFRWEEALSFEGETGPYLQYTNARCHSLLKRGRESAALDISYLTDDASNALILELSRFSDAIRTAYQRLEPMVVSRYLMGVAKLFNRFYQSKPILVEDLKEQAARLALVRATSIVLENGMRLINMHAPEKM